jgi:UDP-N-acetylglucosamine/UDP-N-acetylgalactosamine diphosphorylase
MIKTILTNKSHNGNGAMKQLESDYKLWLAKARAAGQEHVFGWWEELDDHSRRKLLEQVKRIDFDLMSDLSARHLHATREKFKGPMEPAEIVPLPRTEEQFAQRQRMSALGAEAIRRGKVALFIVAGGQGSRLKYDPPKGTFPICPITEKTLFHVFAEKILATSRRYNVTIPLYVMTSPVNNGATAEFFELNDYFGLGRDNVMFAVQDTLPTLDFSGKFILKEKDEIFMNPNGHGGSIKAMKDSGALDDMRRRGIKHICYHQVDNVLARSIDPVFLGYHIAGGAEMSLKVLEKDDAEEKLGVVGMVDGRLTVIEYSDLACKLMHARRSDCSLVYGAGSIAIHILDVDFVERMNEGGFHLPYHVARKKTPFINDKGEPVEPEEPNAIKFETFIFDALPEARAAVTLETERAEEFAPLKNKTGDDSPETVAQALSNCYGRWLRYAGVDVPVDAKKNVIGKIEISPLYALDADDLAAGIDPNLNFTGELLLE